MALSASEILDLVQKTIHESKEVIRITCPRCGYVWNYRGKSNYRADCYQCHTSVILNPKRKKKVKRLFLER